MCAEAVSYYLLHIFRLLFYYSERQFYDHLLLFFLPFCSIKCNLKSPLIKFMIINMTINHNNSSNIEIR